MTLNMTFRRKGKEAHWDKIEQKNESEVFVIKQKGIL